MVKREKERQLRRALWEMRDAIDRYKDAGDRGSFQIKVGSYGYPPDLETLVNGVDIGAKKVRFLRRVPVDLLPKVSAIVDIHALRNVPAWDVLPENTSYYPYTHSGAAGSDQLQPFSKSETYPITKRVKAVFLALDHPWDGCKWCCTPKFTG